MNILLSSRNSLVVVIAIAPCLLAPKCFEYNPAFDPDGLAVGGTEDLTDNQTEEATETTTETEPFEFVAAEPCPNQGEAYIDVGDYFYAIVCGCLEDPWTDFTFGGDRQCTIPVGTVVKWRFAGGEDHNIVSEGVTRFTSSGDQLAGTFEYTFNEVGDYSYGCTIHEEMNGYTIRVR